MIALPETGDALAPAAFLRPFRKQTMKEELANTLERISLYQFNTFNGQQIVADLQTHADLWVKVWMNWNDPSGRPADALYIQTTDFDKASRLIELGQEWCADDGLEAVKNQEGVWIVSGWWD